MARREQHVVYSDYRQSGCKTHILSTRALIHSTIKALIFPVWGCGEGGVSIGPYS